MIVWEFFISPDQATAFVTAYGPRGDWGRLFGKGAGYLGTFLIKDDSMPTRYLTIDRWFSKQHYDRFRLEHAGEYQRLDDEFSALTISENHIGSFTSAEEHHHSSTGLS